MNQKNIIAFCLFVLLTSCLNQKPKDNDTQVKPYPHIINMSQGFQNKSNLKLSDIADSIRYVVLSKDKKVLIGGVRNVQLTDNNIYLKSDNLVMRFDLSGNFLNSFGSVGRGPQEYLPGSIFTTTPKDEMVLVLRSAMYSFLSFKPDGSYIGIKDFSVPRTLFNFTCISDSVLLCTFYYVGSIMKDYILNSIDLTAGLFDLNGNKIKGIEHPLKNIKISSTDSRNIVSMAPSFTYFDNRVILAPEGDTIYEIDNNSMTKGFIIDWGKIPHKQSIEEIYFRQTESSNKVTNYMPLLETSTKAFFRGNSSSDFYIFEYDKITSTCRSMTVDQENLGFINDLDGGASFYPYWTNRAGNIWIVNEDAYSFKEKHSKASLSNSVALYPKMRERLKGFLDSLKQDDNPILKIVYLKKGTRLTLD
jgi:hypothetical protein